MERSTLSEEKHFGLNLGEKFLGLILLIIGSLSLWYTFTSSNVLEGFTSLFGFLGLIITVLGLILIIIKTE
jgi:hypothetical protein